MARAILETAGIRANVQHTSSYLTGIGGMVTIWVREEDMERALEVLKRESPKDFEFPDGPEDGGLPG